MSVIIEPITEQPRSKKKQETEFVLTTWGRCEKIPLRIEEANSRSNTTHVGL